MLVSNNVVSIKMRAVRRGLKIKPKNPQDIKKLKKLLTEEKEIAKIVPHLNEQDVKFIDLLVESYKYVKKLQEVSDDKIKKARIRKKLIQNFVMLSENGLMGKFINNKRLRIKFVKVLYMNMCKMQNVECDRFIIDNIKTIEEEKSEDDEKKTSELLFFTNMLLCNAIANVIFILNVFRGFFKKEKYSHLISIFNLLLDETEKEKGNDNQFNMFDFIEMLEEVVELKKSACSVGKF